MLDQLSIILVYFLIVMFLNLVVHVYFYVTIAISIYFFIAGLANILEMKIRSSLPTIKNGPFVSVLIPARNEEKNIEKCISSLQNQDYGNYEILVIDDNSKDSTYEIIKKLADQDNRVKAFKGKPLPEGWFGKPFALEQIVPHAKGEILIFTDADTIHKQTSISWAVTNMETNGADFISGNIRQNLETFGERITVPILFFLTGFLVPLFLGRFIKLGYFSFAIGQYIVIKKEMYTKTGGFAAVKNKTSEDLFLARDLRKKGKRLEFLDISGQACCRMYTSWWTAIQGIGKNTYDFHRKNPIHFILNAIGLLIFLCLPFPLLVCSVIFPVLGLAQSPYLIHLCLVNVLFTITWIIMFTGRRINWHNALLWPVIWVNLLFMMLWSFYRTVTGRGFNWKGRIVS